MSDCSRWGRAEPGIGQTGAESWTVLPDPGETSSARYARGKAHPIRFSTARHKSTLSAAAETGHLDLAYDYLGEAALIDLCDLEHNTRDELHIASLPGAWIALVNGFGGLRLQDGTVSVAPRLSDGLTRLAFTMFTVGGAIIASLSAALGVLAVA